MDNKNETVYSVDMIIEKIMQDDKQHDLSKIISAYEVAAKAHQNQRRSSGEPYISHPLAVAFILLEFGLDTDTICAALLHDVVEDTDITLDEIKKMFGQDVATLVDGVTKLDRVPLNTKEEQQAGNVHKMLQLTIQEPRVMIIKLCDRLHNIRTLQFQPAHKQRDKALETMNIYAPIAHRLGMRLLKDEIEDLSFKYLDPFAYTEIENMLTKSSGDRDEFIRRIKDRILERFVLSGFDGKPPHIEGRVKSTYGIYKKAYLLGKSIDEIYDKYAVRIIVDSVNECYNALGIIHDMFSPIPNRFKDYIATPKPNMYQSLHTTVIGDGNPFEVQIRTWEMHHVAEDGIAAHWKYKEGIQGKDRLEKRLAWIRQILEAQKDAPDVEEIVRAIKNDVAPEEVYALTPKGKTVPLPAGANVIDFAYAIHTEIGNKMNGAKVDGKLVSFNHEITTGEVVEILTSKDPNHGPNRAWLDLCKTNEARSKIRSWLKKERREENLATGKSELEKEFKRNSINVPESELSVFLADDMKRHNCTTVDDFYAAVGYGGVILSRIIQRLKDRYIKIYSNETAEIKPVLFRKSKTGIILGEQSNILCKYSQCCNPLPGDDIIGFITRGHGISVHKTDCENYKNALKASNQLHRWVEVSWAEDLSSSSEQNYFKVTLDIIANESISLLADITTALAEMHIYITEIHNQTLKNGNYNVTVTISAAGVTQLNNIINRLRKIPCVISVDRVIKS